jgi:hypothetical protein
MSEQGKDAVGELWKAVNDLHKGQSTLEAEVKAGFARIETLLTERCEARMDRIVRLEKTDEDHAKRLGKVEKTLERISVKLALIAGLGALVGSAIVTWLFRILGG